jgi:hypothetical protein
MKHKIQTVQELKQSAGFFKSHGHVNTSRWISFIADNYERNQLSDYYKDYLDVLDAFKSDVCRDNFTRKVQRESHFNKILLKTYPLIHDYVDVQKNIRKITEIFQEKYKSGDIEKSFYILSFLYLLEVESGFENIIRVIYALNLAAQDKPIRYEELFTKRLKEIQRELDSKVFFLGWEDGHLRNAIAHAHFKFDENENKISLFDIDPWQNRRTYEKSFSFGDFIQKARMIGEVTHIFIDYIVLLRIMDLIKHKWLRKKLTSVR